MKLQWHREARADLRQIRSFIAADHPEAAAQMAQCILQATDRLAADPEVGRPGRVSDTRELVIIGTPCLAPYTIAGNRIIILRVLHAGLR
ncbi:type II toxin-antitoxin system RelE/ParE family toxin [uncultured Thiodictyon sp.]|uniref:type II toxin-antitoxin system RelE/ParE family toxin n=1 Tax=uncultured Thiodictyon sp. TaxID=1846217 RepID=UPI0025D0F862|nr:type II toxin-antitoxin system RelE/ParE family toxin [uncultured Thiodictyon sp.]